MKKFGFVTVIGSGLAAAVLGFAAPVQAIAPAGPSSAAITAPQGIDHLNWLDDIQPKPNVPRVDTSVRSNP
jgi:hypothetical protein